MTTGSHRETRPPNERDNQHDAAAVSGGRGIVDELTPGTIVEITGRVIKIRPLHSRQTQLHTVNYPKPITAMVLGKSQLRTGTVQFGGEYESNYLVDMKSHVVWMVMPIASTNRYRKPIAVLQEQVQP